jgi:hypothetical protein
MLTRSLFAVMHDREWWLDRRRRRLRRQTSPAREPAKPELAIAAALVRWSCRSVVPHVRYDLVAVCRNCAGPLASSCHPRGRHSETPLRCSRSRGRLRSGHGGARITGRQSAAMPAPSGVLTIANESGGDWICEFNPFNPGDVSLSRHPALDINAVWSALTSALRSGRGPGCGRAWDVAPAGRSCRPTRPGRLDLAVWPARP